MGKETGLSACRRVFKDVGLAGQPDSGMSRILNACDKDFFSFSAVPENHFAFCGVKSLNMEKK